MFKVMQPYIQHATRAREVDGWADGLTNMTFFGGRHSNRIEIVVFLFMATLVLATVSHIDCPPSYEGPA